ncbi:MAG: hypothetical protein JWN71_3152 [Xanthobacteraceae bacterium]|jgi:hypothetical protein|nr:hypothetical protein [Xanthobacteraceae bacterium]
MVATWSSWQRFPDRQRGESLQAPIGPGVYEVRHAMSGRMVAFGPSGQVANALTDLMPNRAKSFWHALLGRERPAYRSQDLEYRTCATATKREAKTFAGRLSDSRRTVFRRRSGLVWAGN